MNTPPIVFVDDDPDDLETISTALEDIGAVMPVVLLKSGLELLGYLRNTAIQPTLVVTDINMPGYSGLVTKQLLDDDTSLLRSKNVPFVFWSTTNSPESIRKAYELGAKSFFVKPTSYPAVCMTLQLLIDYATLGTQLPTRPI